MFVHRGGCKIYLLLIADSGPRNVACNDLSLATRVHDICYMTSAIVWIKQVKSDYAVLAPAHPDSTVHDRFSQRAALHEFVTSPTSSKQCDPIASQTHLQIISRIISDDMMLEGPAASGGNAGPSMQPAVMPMVADQTSPPRKLLRQNIGGSGQDLSAVHAGGKPRCPFP